MILGRWFGIALMTIFASFSTWKVDSWLYGKQVFELIALHQAELMAMTNAASAQVRQVLEKQQATQKMLIDLDARSTREKAHDLAENEKLRADVAAGDRRLRIIGRCSSGVSNLSDTTSAARLDDDGTVELTRAAGQIIFDLRARIIKDQSALKGLQQYIREVCQ